MRQLFNKCVLFLGPVVLLSVLASCKQEQGQPQERPQKKVDVVIVEPTSLSVLVTSTGDLLPNEQVEIKAPVAGNVMSINFNEGSYVKKGAPLITIDDRSWKAQLEGLKAEHASATSELKRKEALLVIEGASTEEVEQAKATVENLQAQINEMEIMIDLASVKAPFSGQVGMRDFSLGAYLQQGNTITTLAQTNPIKIDFNIASKYASEIDIGQQVKVASPTSNDTAVATVYAIDPVINLSNRSLQVRAILDNESHHYIPGDFIQVIVELSENGSALLLPAESVIPELNTHVVYKIKEGKTTRQEITIGTRTKDAVQAISGISPGDTIVVTGLLEVEDGEPAQVGAVKAFGAL